MRKLLALALVCASAPALAQTFWVRQDANLPSLVGYNLTIDQANNVGIPSDTCSVGNKVYNVLAINPSGGTMQVLGHANAMLKPGDRYFVKGNAGDESVVSCNGVNYLQVKVSKRYWIQKNGGGAGEPSGRRSHAFSNANNNVSLMFGGTNGSTVFADLWKYDATTATWGAVTTGKTKPTARYAGADTYGFPGGVGKFMFFGGLNGGGGFMNETWLFTPAADFASGTWVKITTSKTLSVRARSALAWDAANNRYVLFGGYYGNTAYDDTWVNDGATWTKMNPATKPAARRSHSMAYVPSHTNGLGTAITMNKVVMFGGDTDYQGFGDMWAWNGTTWSQITQSGGPANLRVFGMSWDTSNASDPRLAINGGVFFDGTVNADTWYFTFTSATAGTWSKETPPGAPIPLQDTKMTTATLTGSGPCDGAPSCGRRVYFGGTTDGTPGNPGHPGHTHQGD